MLDARQPEEAPVCLNCGEKLLGDYCWRCGQEAVDLHRPVRELAGNFFEDVLDLDTRLLRSIRPLLLRPGFLTREHLAGRRIRYTSPLKLYLIATLLFFGLVSLLPRPDISVVVTTEKSLPTQGGTQISFHLWRFEGTSALSRRLREATQKAEANPRKFGAAVLENAPRAFFLLLPVVALLLRLFYWRRGLYSLDHLVFALHYHAFVFIALALMELTSGPWIPETVSWSFTLLIWLWLVAYLVIALRRVYGGSRLWTALKLAGLGFAYLMAFGATMAALSVVTLYLF